MKYHIETKGKDKAYMILYRRVREDICLLYTSDAADEAGMV